MSEVSKSLIVSFDALNLVKGIKSIGGPDKQVFYIESNLYAPDRRITPLILQPYISVEDPHEIISSGDKVGELSSAEWYFDEIKSENRITAKEENASIDTPFALGANNSLHIRKNVEKAIQLFFEAEYLDTRKNKNIHISLTYLLSTTQSSEVKPSPKLKLSKPQNWKYCPLDKVTEATIEAEVFADNKGYKSAVEWCKVEGDKVTPLTNEAFVIGGQNTDKLIVNPHVMGDSLIRARNVSEEFYNKAYGVNPEWDNRMKEVFENRNLIVSKKLEMGWYDVKDGSISRSGSHYRTPYNEPIPIKEKIIYLAQGKERIVILFYKENGDYISSIDIKELPKAVTPPHGASLARMYFLNPTNNLPPRESLITEFKLKLSEGDKATPYTPAPEDLNWENLLFNSVFASNGYRWSFNDVKFIKEENRVLSISPLGKGGNAGIVQTSISGTKPTKGELLFSYATINTPKPCTLNILGYSQSRLVVSLNKGTHTVSSLYNCGDNSAFRLYFDLNDTEYTPTDMITIKDIGTVNLSTKFPTEYRPTKDELMQTFKEIETYNPKDLAPDGILPGTYQSDIKFTKYFPEINAEILFLTGDSIRPEYKTVKAQAVFTTNKEPIKNPSEFFNIEWYLDPVEAGGEVKKIGTGEFMEIPVSDLQLKGGRLVPIRLKYNFK